MADASKLAVTPGEMVLRIDSELLLVDYSPGNGFQIVTRGYNGTTPAAHGATSDVYLAFDQRGQLRNAAPDIGAFETQIPTVDVTVNNQVYDATPDAVTDASVTGLNNDSLATFGDAQLSYTYYLGSLTAAQIASAPALSGAPVHAGDYTVVAHFTSDVTDYRNADSAPVHFSITPAPLTISAVTDSKTYDGTTDSTATPAVGTLYGSDTVSGLTQAFASKDVLGDGNSTLNVTGYTINDGNGGADYTISLQSASGTITPATLTVSAVSDSKTYDGTTDSTATPAVGTLYGSDTVTGLTQAFASKDVLGDGNSTLNVTGYTVNDGNGGADYTVSLQSATGTITPATLVISTASDSKTYDGTTDSSATPAVGTLYGSDTVSGLTQAFASKDVLGDGNSTLNVTGYTVNDGNGGADYTVSLQSASGTITPAPLVISAASDSKTYDGTTDSTVTPTVGMLYGSDTVSGLTQAFASKDVLGAGNSTLNVTGYTVNDGNGGADYTVSLQSASGTITPAPLTISAVTDSKTYDGTTDSTATPTVGTLYGSDTVSGLTQAFASKDVLGAGNSTLNVTGYTVNDGNGGADYTVSLQSAPGTINPAPLSITPASVTIPLGGGADHVLLATFTDAGGALPVGDYSAQIDWGDGSASTAGTIEVSGGVFQIFGSHEYFTSGAATDRRDRPKHAGGDQLRNHADDASNSPHIRSM